MAFTTTKTIASFGGKLFKLTHQSTSTGTPMAVNLYLPPTALHPTNPRKVPLLIYLSGLTCTPDNCSEKGFLQHRASALGLAILYPDTSPRHTSATTLPGEDDAYDFGSGAGFYLDAIQPPWAGEAGGGGGGYRMESYVTRELPSLLFSSSNECEYSRYLAGPDSVSITGHSMGGHGALTLYLRHPGLYRSVSAFAPIANPSRCPWGRKAFEGYLGAEGEGKEDGEDGWKRHDATELVRGWKKGEDLKALVDVGTGDDFYKQGQLLPENFERAAKETGVEGLTVRYQEGYDHSYYFMASFADEHVEHAAKHLGLL
ncbi:S-formylglutathione hydrol [Parathielavia hyrcaniae]|uniref:S-formylglutathione hydrolase n=1 Tax=Parathielavia hyrcaniae TaxID=113614 RepID=A0AAN6QBX1_9PEZI|nr:S-formylglutathione hydrol [Parathielavia hyrcaniae]